MNRRAVLASMSVGAASLAGCLGGDPESDPEISDPEEMFEQRWEAIKAEDPDAYRELYHSDSPERDTEHWNNEEWWEEGFPGSPFSRGEPYHQEIRSQTESEAILREEVVVGDDDGPRHEFVYELRTENGQWRMWDREALGYVYPEHPEDFEECTALTWFARGLPGEAQHEVDTALEEGYYETDEELYLPHLLDLSKSYLKDPDVADVYYEATVEEDGEISRLTLSEAIPSRGNEELSVENRSLESLSVTLMITRERDGEIVLEWSGEIPPEDSVTVGEFERFFGGYTVEIERGEQTVTDSWGERDYKRAQTTISVDLEETDGGDDEALVLLMEPRPEREPISCPQIWAK